MRKTLLVLCLSVFPLIGAHAGWQDGSDYPDTIIISSVPYTCSQDNTVYLLSGNLVSNGGGIVLNGRSYIKLDGRGDTVTFDATGSGYVSGLEINSGSNHVSITNLTVTQAVTAGSYGSPGGDNATAILLGTCEYVFIGDVNAHVGGHSSEVIQGEDGDKQGIEIWRGNYTSFSRSFDSRYQVDGADIKLGSPKANPDTYHFYVHGIRIDSCCHAGLLVGGISIVDSNYVSVDAFNQKPNTSWANAHAIADWGHAWAGSHFNYNTVRTGTHHSGGRGMYFNFAAGTADAPVEMAYNNIIVTSGQTEEADAARGLRVRWGCFYLRVHDNYIKVSCDDDPNTQYIGTTCHGIWFGAIGEEGSQLGAHNWFYNNEIHADYYGSPANAPTQAACFIADVVRDSSLGYGNDNRSFNNHFYSNVRCMQLGDDYHDGNEWTSVGDTIEWEDPQFTGGYGWHEAVGVGAGPSTCLNNRLVDDIFINCSSADVGNRSGSGIKSIYAMRSVKVDVSGTNGLPILGATVRIWNRYANTADPGTAVLTGVTNSRGIVSDTLPYWYKYWNGTAETDSTFNDYVIYVEKGSKSSQTSVTLGDVSTGPGSVNVTLQLDTLGQASSNNPPTAPTVSSPSSGSTISTLQPTLYVNNGSDPDGDPLTYDFELYDASGTNLILSKTGITQSVGVTSWTISTTLAASTQYRWRARCYDGIDYSPWMPMASFITPSSTDNTPPNAPTMHAPVEGSVTNQSSPTLSVLNGSDADGDNLTYSFELYDSAGATLIASADNVIQGPYYTTWTVPVTLDDSTTYSWRARCYDGTDYSNWTTPWHFTVDLSNPLDLPSASSPLNGATVVGEPIVLIVNNSNHASGLDVNYDFFVFADKDLTQPVEQQRGVPETLNKTAMTCTFTPTDSHEYWWQARARDATDTTALTAPSSFTYVSFGTRGSTVATASSPADGSTVDVRRLTLTALNIEDPGTHDYYFEVATDSIFANLVAVSGAVLQNAGGSTSWQLDRDLTSGNSYFWHVRADQYAFSQTNSFAVVPEVIAYPNPVYFSRGDVVTFQLPDKPTDLMIQTVSGETVLVEKSVSGDWQWDGHNSSGHRVAVGTYLWYVSSSGQSGKLVVKP